MDKRKLALLRADDKARKALMSEFVLEDVHLHRVDRHTFTVFVGGDPLVMEQDVHGIGEPGVEFNMADRLEINLAVLSGISKTRPILVNLSTCGGSWDEGMKMFGALLACPNPITVYATKWARSMTSLIPLAADRFVMRPPGQYMIHHGSYMFAGLAQEALTNNDELLKSREMMLRMYVARLRSQGSMSTKSERIIRLFLEDAIEHAIDVWWSCDEALKLGFLDGVYEGDQSTLRAVAVNRDRRRAMWDVLRRPIKVTTTVS